MREMDSWILVRDPIMSSVVSSVFEFWVLLQSSNSSILNLLWNIKFYISKAFISPKVHRKWSMPVWKLCVGLIQPWKQNSFTPSSLFIFPHLCLHQVLLMEYLDVKNSRSATEPSAQLSYASTGSEFAAFFSKKKPQRAKQSLFKWGLQIFVHCHSTM